MVGVRHFVSIEVGELLELEKAGISAINDRLTFTCAGNIARIEAASATDTEPIENVLRLDDFPGDAAPRAMALAGLELMADRNLAVRERIDSKRKPISPTLTPTAAVQPPLVPTPAQPPVPRAVPERKTRVGVAGVLRTFPIRPGPALWGGQLQMSTTLHRIWQLAVDTDIAHGQSAVSNLGAVSALAFSSGAAWGPRIGDSHFGARIGLGGRVGIVRLSGESASPSTVSAASVWHPWGGPMTNASIHVGWERVALTLTAEAGQSLLAPEGKADGIAVIALRGPWLGLCVGAGSYL